MPDLRKESMKISRHFLPHILVILIIAPSIVPPAFPAQPATVENIVTIKPIESPKALRNPLKGFRTRYPHPFATLSKTYIKWSDLESTESDGIDKILRYCDQQWKDYPERNMKAIPRIWLYMPNDSGKSGWPYDLEIGDYSSAKFKERVVRLIKKLGAAWDNDPRVAYVEMGIIGYWGEHHHPVVSQEMEKVLGDSFTAAFKHKLVMVRRPKDFSDYNFGIYWDSWAHYGQIDSLTDGGKGIMALRDRWKTAVIGGEIAYDWGNYRIHPGDDINDTLGSRDHLEFLLDSIRRYHCNHIGIPYYDQRQPLIIRGAEKVQKALGYRFVIDEVRYPKELLPGEKFDVSFVVRNIGSSPFYYNWPVEVSLLDSETRQPVWKETFLRLDIRTWLPGDQWGTDYLLQTVRLGEKVSLGWTGNGGSITGNKTYLNPPQRHAAKAEFTLKRSIKTGRYILALAILDPAGMLPSARFAIRNYFIGGRHPIGLVGVGESVSKAELNPEIFDDIRDDATLHYLVDEPIKSQRGAK